MSQLKKALIPVLVLAWTGIAAQDRVPASQNTCNPKTLSVLWQQTSAEYRALCYQAFNLATLRINEIPAKVLRKKNLALITDLDETILDNSSLEAQMILDNQQYQSSAWKKWTNLEAAAAVPGAAEFLNAAYAKGISIYYISNRDTGEIVSTLNNLKALALPCADTAHMLFMGNTSSKESRRQQVLKDHRVIMLLGDNLNDFASCFEKRSIAERNSEADRLQKQWGDRFIVLPNSTYGEWENALYGYRRGLSPAEKDSIRTSLLKGIKSR